MPCGNYVLRINSESIEEYNTQEEESQKDDAASLKDIQDKDKKGSH